MRLPTILCRIASVRHEHGYVPHLTFSDGLEGEIDLTTELHGEIFVPLCDPAYFVQAFVDEATHTVAWPNGADFAPEFLRERLEANDLIRPDPPQ